MKHGVKHGGWPAGCFCPIFVDANFSQEVFFAGISFRTTPIWVSYEALTGMTVSFYRLYLLKKHFPEV